MLQMAPFQFPLFFLLLILVCVTVDSRTYWQDIEALKEFKNSVLTNSSTPGSCLISWDFSLDPCDSLFGKKFTCGFRCDVTVSGSTRISELSLDQAGYSGSLSSVTFNFSYLQTLDLTGNFFYGSIPDSLSNLAKLIRLALSGNSFSGTIPPSIGSISSLEELYLDHNQLEGGVPSSFNSLTSLKRLELQSNNLTGGLPDLSSLANLFYLDVSENGMSGRVPSALPESLIQISMRNNSMEGLIPENFKHLRSLQVVDLSCNKLSGSIPAFMFTHSSLQQLTLSFNHLTSLQSPYYTPSGLQSELIAVDLSNNEIQGLLPLFMGLMPKLSALSLENNRFSGMIPTQYALKTVLPERGFAPLERLLLGGNYLFGPIPGQLMGLKPGSANVRLTSKCLLRCPAVFFYCQGGEQKPFTECKRFSHVIPRAM